jgi:hypothetical protein
LLLKSEKVIVFSPLSSLLPSLSSSSSSSSYNNNKTMRYGLYGGILAGFVVICIYLYHKGALRSLLA